MNGVFDSKDFYKTGDLARREGSNYFILGRVSQDETVHTRSSRSFEAFISLHVSSLGRRAVLASLFVILSFSGFALHY